MYGKADGTNKTFYVPKNYIIDSDSDDDGFDTVPDYTDDIVVYDDDISVTITSVDIKTGEVILTAAPVNESVMKVTYARSPIKDSQVVLAIQTAQKYVNKKARMSVDSESKTQYWNGNGKETKFQFKYRPVTSAVITVNDGAMSEGGSLDYVLQSIPDEAFWIEFRTAPSTSRQNIKAVYDYGNVEPYDTLLSELVKHEAALRVLNEFVAGSQSAKGSYIGKGQEMKFFAETKRINQRRMIQERLDALWDEIGGNVLVSKI